MKVLKFGGTSVGSAEGLRQVKLVVESCREEVIVVVSALGGITDQLLLTSRMAAAGDMQYKSQLEQIVMRHCRTVDEVVDPACRAEVLATVNTLLDELSNIFKGVYLIKDLSPKTSDAIVSYGERLSSVIVRGVLGCAELYDAREFIKTRPYFGKHVVEFAPTEKLIRERFAAMPKVVVVPGFIAADYQSDDVTNLGRGGSDYTASVLAATLKADALEIWTDVDGFMTADPKVISNAYVIEHLTFVEAMELCNFGAKVIYPPTIFPAYHNNIPISIRNTFNPDAPGTYVSEGKGRRQPYDQGYFVDQRYLPDYHQGFGYGRRDRRQLPHLQSPVEIGYQRVLRFAGRFGKHNLDRCAQRRCRIGRGSAFGRVRTGNCDG